MRGQDLTGRVFGDITVLSYSGTKTKNKKKLYFCRCLCGVEKLISACWLLNSRIRSCGCRQFEPKLLGNVAGVRYLYRQYKNAARIHKRIFELTIQEFEKLITSDCVYCGKSPSTKNRVKLSFLVNGVDRVDSNIGYVISNCVSCCKRCNWVKNDLSVSEFVAHADSISMNFREKLCHQPSLCQPL